ncbi:uncharacterized protein EDB93DRAFT_1041264, partial [Suillus bovinus]|uniref:uncharacterized protein n=1 Tax=Suillus bovinus TaxID=48563 RepID=UPI001B86172B
GVRYSELLCLPYWNPVLFTVLNSMHADFLLKLHHHIHNICTPLPCPARPSNSALASGLCEIWMDQARTQLPSFVTAAPLVAAEKRTPTADHWHSIGLIHLIVTLIFLWEVLHNYMHLVTTIHITNMRSMSKDKINLYSFHYKECFRSVLKLYKEAQIRPVHHMAFHYEMLLKAFGPVHSWWAWAFERFNYTLQNIKTNSRFGE